MLTLPRTRWWLVRAVLVVVAAALAGPVAAQVTYPPRPAEGEFIADLANLVTPEDEAAVKKAAAGFLQSKGIPIITVTINSLSEYGASRWPIERYAMNLFGEWQIGDATRNTGVLLLVSKNDRKVRIEMGGGFTHERDVAAAEIINRTIVPRFKQGDFSGGVRAGVEAIAANIDNPRTALTPGAQGGSSRTPAAASPASNTSPVPRASPAGTLGGKGLFSALGCFIVPIGLIVLFMVIKAFTRRSPGAVDYGPGPGPAGWGGGWGSRPSSGMGGMLGGLVLGGLLGNAWGSRSHGASSSSSGGMFGGGSSGGGGFGGFGGGGFGGGGSFGGGFSGGGGATGSW